MAGCESEIKVQLTQYKAHNAPACVFKAPKISEIWLFSENTYSFMPLAGVFIACAAMNNVVNLTELQRPGGKRLKVADFLRGFEVQVGMCFGEVS